MTTLPDQIADQWLQRIKETMAVELSRGMTAGMPPKGLITLLFGIPEVEQAFHLRARRRQSLPLDPSPGTEVQEIVEALNRVADWLSDGFHEDLVEQLRGIASDLATD